MPRETGTRKRMIEAAAQLFRARGYAATGLQEVLEKSAAPRGSLYHHFPGGKEELGVEAIRLSAARFEALFRAVMAEAPTAAVGLERACQAMGAGLAASGYELGCPLATTALEAVPASEPIARAVDEGFHSWLAVIRDRLLQDGFAAAGADDLATLALATLEGALILARARRSPEPLDQAGRMLSRIAHSPSAQA